MVSMQLWHIIEYIKSNHNFLRVFCVCVKITYLGSWCQLYKDTSFQLMIQTKHDNGMKHISVLWCFLITNKYHVSSARTQPQTLSSNIILKAVSIYIQYGDADNWMSYYMWIEINNVFHAYVANWAIREGKSKSWVENWKGNEGSIK